MSPVQAATTEPLASTPVHHRNNLDGVRIGAAMLVLVSHSFALTGRPEYRYVSWTPLGQLGVYIFFSISGYLVVESWRRDPHIGRFLARRALRIFPGLAVCVLVTAFALGPAVSSLPLTEYFGHPLPYQYLWNIALSPVFALPGVFEKNVLPGAVNGSLWSLPPEFVMYLVVAVAGMLGANRWVFVALAVAWGIVAYGWAHPSQGLWVTYGVDLRQIFICGVFFLVGGVFGEFKVPRRLTLSTTVLAFVALAAIQPLSPLDARPFAWVLLPAVVLAFGLARSGIIERLTRTGDYSYGVYIYAFPVQQTVAAYWPTMPIGLYILTVTAIVFALAALSWHFIEAPALRLKPRVPHLT